MLKSNRSTVKLMIDTDEREICFILSNRYIPQTPPLILPDQDENIITAVKSVNNLGMNLTTEIVKLIDPTIISEGEIEKYIQCRNRLLDVINSTAVPNRKSEIFLSGRGKHLLNVLLFPMLKNHKVTLEDEKEVDFGSGGGDEGLVGGDNKEEEEGKGEEFNDDEVSNTGDDPGGWGGGEAHNPDGAERKQKNILSQQKCRQLKQERSKGKLGPKQKVLFLVSPLSSNTDTCCIHSYTDEDKQGCLKELYEYIQNALQKHDDSPVFEKSETGNTIEYKLSDEMIAVSIEFLKIAYPSYESEDSWIPQYNNCICHMSKRYVHVCSVHLDGSNILSNGHMFIHVLLI